ncbi:M20/M25/M40 family metallo-hydrolase [Acanthopleuribacter pedis]|uniref:M20/M25/M40 family metallo-hydrolase n=1 Tax=Acanthopleuribacter pedis TaxID=442870 RepID=A0A8J7QE44_9BACT|nr:M20/M25/M40 family metallo-hydrolase [Acanthopleuribacter pedis]MBO1322902.1 M20/M25/M40 family metallo-hydrolase [Acanthopleuribacter pedis]
MKVAVIYNKSTPDPSDVVDFFGPISQEHYAYHNVERVARALESGGHNVRIIEGNISLADNLRDFMPKVMSGERPGLAFNMAYGIQGRSRYTHVPAMLEMLGVPYVGSGPQAHAVALDKITTKIILQANNLPTPAFYVFGSADVPMDHVVFPVIIKPRMEAVSMGLKVVYDVDALRLAVQEVIDTYRQDALVEAFIPGREFAVGLLGNGPDLEVLPIVEFDLHGDPNAIQTVDNKKKQPVRKVCPAQIPDDLAAELRRLARESFHALGVHDFSRIDLRMDADGHLHILELNSMASLGRTGSYLESAKAAGYSDQAMINRMLDVAAVRYFGREYLDVPKEAADTKQSLRFRVRTYLRTQIGTMCDRLKQLAEIPTHTHNLEEVNQAGNWLAGRLVQMGFSKTVISQSEVGNLYLLRNHDEDRDDVLLLGYLDSDQTAVDVGYREERGRIYGTGLASGKGGLVVLLGALAALRYTRRLKKCKITVMLVSDEYLENRFSRNHIAEQAGRAATVIGLSGAPLSGAVFSSLPGQMRLALDLKNQVGKDHGGELAAALCRRVGTLCKLDLGAESTLTPLSIDAVASGRGPAQSGKATFMLGYDDGDRRNSLLKTIETAAKKGLDAKYRVQFRKGVDRPPCAAGKRNQELEALVSDKAKDLEVKVLFEAAQQGHGTCFAKSAHALLEGFGPLGGDAGGTSEFILRDSLIDRAALLALVLNSAPEMSS